MNSVFQKYKIPLEICNIIEKKNFKLVLEELVDKIEKDTNYKMHEFYFVQILPFIKKLIIPKPTFNDNLIFKIFYCDKYNSLYFLYKDHMNHYIYQKNIYNIYYNPL